jgi:16S rRNA (guanine966-N2)-methyltransferase
MRVVGGRLKGRNLASPSTATSARRRTAAQSVFNIRSTPMMIRLRMRVLDLFAGTGALGIEAISRGAAFALFVDNGAPGARAAP